MTPSRGAILLELLLSMTLFLVVLLPLTRFLVRTTGTDRAADIVTATYLARDHMEALRLSPNRAAPSEPVAMNDRTYRITYEIAEIGGLYTMTVYVYRGAEETPLVQLTTRAYTGEEL